MLIGGGVGFPVMVAHLTKFIMMGMRKRSFENDHRPFKPAIHLVISKKKTTFRIHQ